MRAEGSLPAATPPITRNVSGGVPLPAATLSVARNANGGPSLPATPSIARNVTATTPSDLSNIIYTARKPPVPLDDGYGSNFFTQGLPVSFTRYGKCALRAPLCAPSHPQWVVFLSAAPLHPSAPLCTPLHMFKILSFTNIEYIYFIQNE